MQVRTCKKNRRMRIKYDILIQFDIYECSVEYFSEKNGDAATIKN
jgi:hypothetical protein